MKKKVEEPLEKIQIERVTPPIEQGLTDAQVRIRLENGYANTIPEDTSNSVKQIFKSNILTFFNLLFFILAGCIIAVGSYSNLMFMPVVIINIVIGIVQELRAKKVIDQLTVLSAPQATVVRGGQRQMIPVDQLVIDDLIVLGSGNQIPADAVVLNGQVQVNESLITGESDEVTKGVDDELFSGSYVVSGYCIAVLQKVGVDSFASRLTQEAKQKKKRTQSEMMKSLTRLIQVIGFLIVPLGLIVFYRSWKVLGNPLQDSVVSTVASLIGMIPEGLYLLTSVALAVSVIRLGQKKTLVHDMGCIETLARVDTLCVDKTGTITEPDMKVIDLKPIGAMNDSELRHVLGSVTGALPAENVTMQALKAEYDIPSPRRASSILPFSSVTKCSAVFFEENENYYIGAPEFLMLDMDESLKAIQESYAGEGKRVLLFARTNEAYHGSLPQAPEPLAFITLMNPIRAQAPDTFRYFTEQGVDIKVISGDNPLTVSIIARQAGIPHSEAYVDATTLVNDELIEQAMETYTVFGRVTPEQKRQFVVALKKHGHTVAMTGDGVNDLLALKTADCSVAMASGSDAAAQVSHLVLLESNFEAMPSVVAEGRRVVNNIERAASLFLVKNIFSFFITLLALFIPMTYPLTPLQLSLISSLTIGVPSFFLALEPNTNRVTGHFLKNVLFRAMPAGLTNLFLITGTLLFAYAFKIPEDQASTICVIVMGYVGFLFLYRVCSPFNLKRAVLWGLLLTVYLVGILFFGSYFNLVSLSLGSWLVFVVFMLLALPSIRFITHVMNIGAGIWNKHMTPALARLRAKWNEH